MEPSITVRTAGEGEKALARFDDFTAATFYIGMEYGEPEGLGGVRSVEVAMSSAEDPVGQLELSRFVGVLIAHGIDCQVRFLQGGQDSGVPGVTEPSLKVEDEPQGEQAKPSLTDFEEGMNELKEMRRKGALGKKEFKSKRDALLESWRKEVTERLSG